MRLQMGQKEAFHQSSHDFPAFYCDVLTSDDHTDHHKRKLVLHHSLLGGHSKVCGPSEWQGCGKPSRKTSGAPVPAWLANQDRSSTEPDINMRIFLIHQTDT